MTFSSGTTRYARKDTLQTMYEQRRVRSALYYNHFFLSFHYLIRWLIRILVVCICLVYSLSLSLSLFVVGGLFSEKGFGECEQILSFKEVCWLDLTALSDSISVYIGPSFGDREKKKGNDTWDQPYCTQKGQNSTLWKKIRRFYSKILGIWLPVHLPLFLRASTCRTFF